MVATLPDLRQLVIRPATLEDTRAVAALSGELGYPALAADMAGRLSSLQHRTDHAVSVAQLDGRVVAWIHVCVVETLESAPFAEIRGLVVADGFRGCGIGSALIARAEQWAVEKACLKIRVRSNSKRTEAQQFYEKLGYRVSKNQNVFDKLFKESLIK